MGGLGKSQPLSNLWVRVMAMGPLHHTIRTFLLFRTPVIHKPINGHTISNDKSGLNHAPPNRPCQHIMKQPAKGVAENQSSQSYTFDRKQRPCRNSRSSNRWEFIPLVHIRQRHTDQQNDEGSHHISGLAFYGGITAHTIYSRSNGGHCGSQQNKVQRHNKAEAGHLVAKFQIILLPKRTHTNKKGDTANQLSSKH